MVQTTSETTAQALSKVLEGWAAAELHSDASVLAHLLADDFVGIGPRGFMLTKEEWLQRYSSGNLRHESFKWDDVKVRLYENTAIVIGSETEKGKYQGQPIEGQFRTTLVFVSQQGHWRLTGLHLSPILGRP